MSDYSKKGAVKLSGGPGCPPMSSTHKSVPGGEAGPQPMSFSRKKGQAQGGDQRPFGVRADQKLAAAH